MFSIVTIGSCNFVGLPGYEDSKGLGLFAVDVNDSCIRYSRTIWSEPDGARSAGQAFGTLACLALSFCVLGMGTVIFLLQDRLSRLVWLVTRVLLSVAFLCAMFTFSFYSSTLVADICESADDCALGPAGSVGVMNVWLLLGLISLSVCIPIPEEPILDIFEKENKEAANTSFETPKISNERHEKHEETTDDEDLSRSHRNSNEEDLSARFRSNLLGNNGSHSSRSITQGLDEEAVDRAFNPYGASGDSVRAGSTADDPSIVTVSESNFSLFERKFGTAVQEGDEEVPSNGKLEEPR